MHIVQDEKIHCDISIHAHHTLWSNSPRYLSNSPHPSPYLVLTNFWMGFIMHSLYGFHTRIQGILPSHPLSPLSPVASLSKKKNFYVISSSFPLLHYWELDWVLCLLNRCSTTWATSPVCFSDKVFFFLLRHWGLNSGGLMLARHALLLPEPFRQPQIRSWADCV